MAQDLKAMIRTPMTQENLIFNHYQSIFKCLGVYILVLDHDLCIKETSASFTERFSIDGEKNGGQSIFDFELGKQLSPYIDYLQDDFTTEIILEDKTFFRMSVVPQLDDLNGNPPSYIIGLTDIDEAKKNEIFLEDTQSEAHIGSWILDLKTGETKWSKEVFRIYDIPEDTPTNLAQGKASYPKEDQERLENLIQQAIQGSSFVDVFKFITSKDEIKFVRVTGKPLHNNDNEVFALRGSIQDITSEYLTQATTKEALASAKTAVLEWFPLQEEISSDKNWNLLLEVKESSPKENYRLWLEAIHPEDREEWLQRSTVALNDLPNFDIGLRIVTNKGDVKYVQGHFRIYRNQQGEPKRVVGTLTDISRLRRTETELKEQYRIMAQTSKMAQLGEITAGLGHEINNPLAIAMGNHRLITKLLERSQLTEEFKEPLDKALNDQMEALERIRRLVKNFKSFSHSKGHEKQVFDIADTIRETCELFKVLLNRNSIHLTLDIESGLTCQGNRERFNQVITNLISNSIDALGDTQRKSLYLKAFKSGQKITFIIRDNGAGIPEELRDKIFDQFFTTKEVGKGTGIGLALCRSIIEQMGGELSLDETNEMGTQFTIGLPYLSFESSIQHVDDSLNPYEKNHLANLKGALIDDEEGLSLLFKAEVGELGPEITIFNSPLKFLNYLDEQKSKEKPLNFDFVVTDVNMPEMTGLELLQKLMDEHGFTKTQLFVLSGGMPNFLERKIKKIATEIFQKPLDLGHIAHALSVVPQTTSPELTPEEILRNLVDLCEYLGPKIKTSLTLVEFREGKQRTLYVNQSFEKETGYSLKEVYTKNLNLLQGRDTNQEALKYMRDNFKKGETFVVDLLNYKKDGTPFRNRLVLLPLVFSHGTYYFGLQTNLDEFTKEGLCALHEDIMMTLNLPINKVMQELLTLFYGDQLKGQIFQEMTQKLIEEIDNIRHYILKF